MDIVSFLADVDELGLSPGIQLQMHVKALLIDPVGTIQYHSGLTSPPPKGAPRGARKFVKKPCKNPKLLQNHPQIMVQTANGYSRFFVANTDEKRGEI
jgi:hypothetical protein